MSVKADYFTFALETVRRQFPTPRPVDLAFPEELAELAIKERNDERHIAAVRATFYETTDPRRI